jgi:hypothetical protein
MPVADHLVTARIHVQSGLAGKEKHHQRREKHHVPSQAKENKKANFVKELARASMVALPVVVASAAPTPGGSPVNRWFAANSRLFPFDFRWGTRKGNGHFEASVL